MRCKSCDYPLWNLTARLCPECGRPFLPTEFQFIANSVRFCCPHCKQDYYGTGADGHLVPPEFDCVRCHARIHMDQMVLLPTEGVEERQTQVDTVPWLERRTVGIFKGWFGTVWRAMFEPGRLARATPADSSIAQAWWFGFISNVLFLLPSAIGLGLPFLAVPLLAGPRGFGLMFVVWLLGVLLVALVAVALALPVWGFIAHALLRLTGPTLLGPGASVRTVCYANGANAIVAIPCLGFYLIPVAWIWSGISAAAMVRVVHGVSWSRALISVLAAPFCILVAVVGFLTWLLVGIVPNAQIAAASARQSMQQANTQRLVSVLTAYSNAHAGRFPSHAIELIHDGTLLISDLTPIRPGIPAGPGEALLNSFQTLSAKEQASKTRQIVAGMDPATIAHRCGDFVFTYHGIDPAAADPGLWIVIEYPLQPDPNARITVGTAGNTVQSIPLALFPAKLAEQNRLRAPLPPLPDPASIRTDTPATGP